MSNRRSRKHRRYWRIVGGALLLLLLAGAGAVAWRIASKPDTDAMLKAADTASAAGDYSAAVIHFKNVLLEEPDNLSARWRLGQTYLALKQFVEARAQLENARPLAGTSPALWLDLARAQLESGQFEESLTSLERYTGPADPAVAELKARANIALGHGDAAKAVLQAAQKEAPGDASLHLATARLALSEQDFDGALAAAEAALKESPNNTDALLMKGRVLLFKRDTAGARDTFRQVLAEDPKHEAALASLAEALLTAGEPTEVPALIAKLEATQKGTVGIEYLKGWHAYATQDWARAEAALIGVIQLAPKHPQALLMLADSCFQQQKFNQAEEYLTQFEGFYPRQPQARKLLGAIYLKQNRAADAIKTLSPVADDIGADDAGIQALLSYAYFANGEADKGNAALAKAQNLAPDSPALLTQQALGQIAAGETAAGVAQLEKLASTEHGAQPRQALTYLHLLQGDSAAAYDSAQALIKLKPEDPMAYNLLGIAEMRNGKKAEAKSAFEKALAKKADFAPALANLGFLALADKDATTAKQRLQESLAADKRYTAASLALAALVAQAGDKPEALRVLEAAAEANPQAAQPKWLLAGEQLQTGHKDEALKLAKQAYELAPNTPQSRLMWGQFQLSANEAASALAVLKALREEHPEFTQGMSVLAHAARAAGEFDLARVNYNEALKHSPDRLELLWGKFATEIAAKDFIAAETAIRAMTSAHPDTLDAERARGELATAQKRFTDASLIFDGIYARDPSAGNLLRYVDALLAEPDDAKARATLNTYLTKHPEDVPVRLKLGTIALLDNDLKSAQTTFETLLEHAPENPIALNNLAWLYDQNDDERALVYAERAVKALPNSAEAADTLGWILARRDESQKALPLLEKAHTLLPQEPNIRYHYAYTLAELGNRGKAQDILEELLEGKLAFESQSDAQALLRRLRNAGTPDDGLNLR